MSRFHLFIACTLLLIAAQARAINTVAEGFRVTNGGSTNIDAHGTCKKISNTSGVDQFVATKTSGEWSGFLLKLPSGLAASACPVTCPTGYVRVPTLSPYTAAEFCVAKYEMKIQGQANGNQTYNSTWVPEVRAAGTPWVNVTHANAIAECQSLGTGYDLITNSEWQAIARDLELVTTNWSSGTVGSGSINRGHSDNAPASALAADASDTNACSGTGQTCSNSVWHVQRRTHVLSTGEVLWDIAGDVSEVVKDTYAVIYGADAFMSQVTAASHTTTDVDGRAAKVKFGPAGNYTSLNSGEYGGLGYGWLAYTGGVIARGQCFANGGNGVGIFATETGYSSSDKYNTVGFRCVYHP